MIDSLDDLKAEGYKAILPGSRRSQAQKVGSPGHDAKGVMDSLTFLKKVALKQKVPSLSRVVVLGGSDRSIDAARTALRLGAKEVTVLFSRSRKEMPAEAIRNLRGGKGRGRLSVSLRSNEITDIPW